MGTNNLHCRVAKYSLCLILSETWYQTWYQTQYASVRKSLQGLDYFIASGARAFDDLEDAADKLGDVRMGMSWAQQQKKQLTSAKRYLKGNFKVT